MRSKRFYSLPVFLLVLLLALIGCFPVVKPDKTPPVVETPVITLSATTVPDTGGGMTVTVSVAAQDAHSNLKDAVITLTWNTVGTDLRDRGSVTKTVTYPAAKTGTATAAFSVNLLGSDITLPVGIYSFSASAVVQDVKLNKAEPKSATAAQNLTVQKSSEHSPTINVTYTPTSGGKVGIPFTATVVGADTDGDLTYLEFYILSDTATVVSRMATSTGTTSLTITTEQITLAMLGMGPGDFSKTLYWYALARDAQGHVTQYTNKSITAQRMDLAVIESIGHVRTPSEPNMPSHYRVLAGATPPAISELQEDQRLPMQFGVSKMRINLMDSIVLAGYKARGYIFTTTSEIFDATPDVWRAEGAVGADKMLYLDMVNFWRQVDLDTSKWFVLEILNNAGTPIVRYIWNIKALGDTFEPMVSIIDSGKDYREGVPLEFTICATDEFLEAITDLRVRVNIGQKGWRDLEDVVSDMNPAVDQKEGWLFAVRYHVKVQVFPGLTNYASGLVDDGVDYIVSNAIASLNGTGAHQNAKWFDVFHGKIPGMPTTAAGRSEYWWKTDGYGHILAEDDDNGRWPGNRTPDEEPYDPTPSHNTDELDHRALPKWSYVYEFTDLDTTRVNEIRKEAFVENTTFKVWIYPEVVRVNRADIEAGVTKPEVLDVVDVSIGPGTWRDQHVDYQMQIEIADWRWGGENPDIGKVSQSANFTIDEDEETPRIQISGSYSDDPSQSFKHLFKDQWQWYSPVKNYAVPNFFVHELEVFTGASITIKAQDDIALHDLLVFYDSENFTTYESDIDSPKAAYVGRNDRFSHPLTGYDYVYDEGMLAYRLIKGKETTGEATLVPLVYQSLPATPKAFPIEEPRILRILGKDFKINGKIISPIFTLDKNYEYYVNFTNDDVVDSWAIAAHQNSFGRENDIIRANPVDKEYETYAGEYSTVFLGSKLNTPGTKEEQKAEFSFRVPDTTGDYWLWIVARDRSAQDTKLFDYPFDERHDYKEDTYLGEYPSYATKNRQCEIFGTWFDDGSPNFDKMYYDDSMSEDDADMVILLRLRIKSHSWDIVRLDIHEPDLVSYPVKDSCENDIWYMHSYHPYQVANEFDEADLKISVFDLPRDIYPVYKWVEDKDHDPIGLYLNLNNNKLEIDPRELDEVNGKPYNPWKVTDWVWQEQQPNTEDRYYYTRIEGVPVVGGSHPTDFRVKTHEDITKLSMYLIEGEYWDTKSVERDYGNLDFNPDVIAKTTKIADPGNISQWGFWEWTLDWNKLGLRDKEDTYTIVVRGYHKSSESESSFYEQFQWPIFVDTLGPRLSMYNVLETATDTLLPDEILQLNIVDEIQKRKLTGNDPYPVLDWAALLAIDRGGLFFEENKGVPTNGPKGVPSCSLLRNDRTRCKPQDLHDGKPYADYSNDDLSIDEFFVGRLIYPSECWDYRMAEIRSQDLINHGLALWNPCCGCDTYPLFSGYKELSPVASWSDHLGYPGTSTENESHFTSLELRNSLKYLKPTVETVEHRTASDIYGWLLKEYMDNIYSNRLDDDFWDFYKKVGDLPEVALFHNINIRKYFVEKSSSNEFCLGVEMKDELGNLGEWKSKVKIGSPVTLEATAVKLGGCRDNTLNATGTLITSNPLIKMKSFAIREIPIGEAVKKNVVPEKVTYTSIFSGVLQPQWATSRTLRFIGTLIDDETTATQTTLEATYAGNKPIIEIGGLTGIIDIHQLLRANHRDALVPLVKWENRLIVDSGFEAVDSGKKYRVGVSFKFEDDNIDKYFVYLMKPTPIATDGKLPDPGVDVHGESNTFDDPFTRESTASLFQNDDIDLASQYGYITFYASAADCPGEVTAVSTQVKVWYQNLNSFLVSVIPTAPGAGGVATGVELIFQSDLLFENEQDIINHVHLSIGGTALTIQHVFQWNASASNWVGITGVGRNNRFLFEVSGFTPIAARAQRDLLPGVTITVGIDGMYAAAKGLIADWEKTVQAFYCGAVENNIEEFLGKLTDPATALTLIATPIVEVTRDATGITITVSATLTIGQLVEAILDVAGNTLDYVFPGVIDCPQYPEISELLPITITSRDQISDLLEFAGGLELNMDAEFTIRFGNAYCNLATYEVKLVEETP